MSKSNAIDLALNEILGHQRMIEILENLEDCKSNRAAIEVYQRAIKRLNNFVKKQKAWL